MSSNAFQLTDSNMSSIPSGKGMRVGIVVAEWNDNITKALLIVELMQKGETFEEAYADADVNVRDKSEVVKIVDQLVEIVNNYDMGK